MLAGGLLLAAAVPTFAMDTGMAGVDTFADYTESKEGFLVLDEKFSAGLTSPIEIVIDGDVNSPEVQAAIARLKADLETDPRFGPSRLQANEAGDLALLSVAPNSGAMSDVSYEAVRSLRSQYVP